MTAQMHPFPNRDPANDEAEMAVLGAILADNGVFERLRGTVQAEDFYDPLHVEVYAAAEKLIAQGRRADFVTLAPVLKGKKIGPIDAYDYVLGYVEQAPTDPEKLWSYVQEVLHYSARRGVIAAARKLGADAAKGTENLVEVFERANKQMDDAIARTHSRRVTSLAADQAMEAMIEDYDRGPSAIKTGISPLDQMTGGLYLGELSILAGRPGQGKTATALQIGLNMARTGKGVGFYSMEMNHVAIAQRLASSLAYQGEDEIRNGIIVRPSGSIPYNRIRRKDLTAEEQKIVRAQVERLREVPLLIDTQSKLTVSQIAAIARRWQTQLAANGRTLTMLVVDYLGLIEMTNRWGDNRAYAVGEVTAALKDLAKQLNVHVMALHQLNREVEKTESKRPHMHHLRRVRIDRAGCRPDPDALPGGVLRRARDIQGRGGSRHQAR